jgi:hypothetical protein
MGRQASDPVEGDDDPQRRHPLSAAIPETRMLQLLVFVGQGLLFVERMRDRRLLYGNAIFSAATFAYLGVSTVVPQ